MPVSINRDIATSIGKAVTLDTITDTGSLSGSASLTVYDSAGALPSSGVDAGSQAYVSSNQRLYIRGSGGWYNVAVVNNTPTISSVVDANSNTSPFTLANDGTTATVITITATDSEGFPITYSATADSGFNGLATVSNDSSVFTITPFSEDSATTSSGTLTFKASDGVNIASQAATFTITFSDYTLNRSVPITTDSNHDLGVDSSFTLSSYGQWTFTPNIDMTVDIKMWGAAGAGGNEDGYGETLITEAADNASHYGGAGGYTSGRISLTQNTKYLIRVGQGGYRSRDTDDPQNATYLAGGIHPNFNTSFYMSLGGGYTGFFDDSAGGFSDVIMIAGGGGGGPFGSPGSGPYAGGGATAQGGTSQDGGGGTQSGGGQAGSFNSPGAGSQLTGGHGAQNTTSNTAGGGGGYYGGGGSNVGGGGGGSGFFSLAKGVSSGTTTTGSGSTPPNSSDTDRGSAGSGTSLVGNDGLIKITRVS